MCTVKQGIVDKTIPCFYANFDKGELIPALNALRTSASHVSVKGLFPAGWTVSPERFPYALTATPANSVRVFGSLRSTVGSMKESGMRSS